MYAMSNKVYGLIVAFSLFLFEGIVQSQSSKNLATKIDNYLQESIQQLTLAGVAVAVVKDGEVIYKGAHGVRNIQTQEPLQTNHFFHFASVSKPFVATAVMQLVEMGKMDLNAKVTTYLPYFELADERYKDITILQMLNHTAGMPDVDDYEWDKPQTDEGAAERFVKSLKDQTLLYSPGEGWDYSNMAFDVMGDVIAKVSGMPFETFIKKHIFDPLGMTHSSFIYSETPESLRTTPHVWDGGVSVSSVYPYNRRHAPSSTLNSSVEELTHWALANLNKGTYQGKQILQPSSYDFLWNRSTKGKTPKVGLSWFMGKVRGTTIISHSGGDTGYESFFGLFPDKNMALVMAGNFDLNLETIQAGVIEILMGKKPRKLRESIAFSFGKILMNEGIDAAKVYYQKTKKEQSKAFIFGQEELNLLGYFLLYDKKNPEKAIEVFQYNVELFPKKANVYDSLAEAYAQSGDKKMAKKYYEKALSINPKLESARRALGEL